MRCKTRGLLLVGTVLVAVGLMGGTALGQEESVEVSGEVSGTHCGTVVQVGHAVSGGCLVEFVSTEHIQLHAYIPQEVTVMMCDWHLTARLGENGQGYVVAGSLATEPEGSNPPCTRAPCDEANGAFLPWPISVVEHMPATEGEELEVTSCLRTVASGPGGAGTNCELHLAWSAVGFHDYEIGRHGPTRTSEEFCETLPSPPVSFEDVHFRFGEGSEGIEVNHL